MVLADMARLDARAVWCILRAMLRPPAPLRDMLGFFAPELADALSARMGLLAL
jgi:hypothetical protein